MPSKVVPCLQCVHYAGELQRWMATPKGSGVGYHPAPDSPLVMRYHKMHTAAVLAKLPTEVWQLGYIRAIRDVRLKRFPDYPLWKNVAEILVRMEKGGAA